MRKLFVTAVLTLLCLSATKTMAQIKHTIDGNISEWPADKFETDKETQILYSVDHDATNLYVALKIANPQMQMKLMRQGMIMFIDKKGKKKEGTGIEFPVKHEGGGFNGRSQDGAPGEKPDFKKMRDELADQMIFLKTFGFDDQEDKTVMVGQPNGVSVVFDFDNADIMYIEYQVPVSFIGSAASLKDKPLDIGWKINGLVQQSGGSGSAVSSSSSIVGTPAGSGPSSGGGKSGGRSGGGRPAGVGSSTPRSEFDSNDPRFKEQKIWTKHVFTL